MNSALPARYAQSRSLLELLQARVVPALEPNQTILDIGAGRLPTIPRADRPPGVCYAGLDIVSEELDAAADGAYDETFVSDITRFDPRLSGRFDIATGCHVLEHVRSVPSGLENVRRYLHPGGRLMILFACTFSVHALFNRILPERVGATLLERPPDTKFVAIYDHCWPNALRTAMVRWSDVEVVPLFLGAHYFGRWPRLQQAYLRYENWAERRQREHLASHLLLFARS
jgi:SAM-dependent methyltransferase